MKSFKDMIEELLDLGYTLQEISDKSNVSFSHLMNLKSMTYESHKTTVEGISSAYEQMKKGSPPDYGQQCRNMIQEMGISIQEIAEKSGIPEKTLLQIQYGLVKKPYGKTRRKLESLYKSMNNL